MGAAGAAKAQAVRVRAQAEQARAAKLCRDAAANRRRTDELCDRFASGSHQSRKRSYGDHGERFLLRLGRLRPLLRFARNDLRRWLEATDLPTAVVDDATLAFSEACANALEHPSRAARQLVEVAACRDAAQLVLHVRDYGSWTEHDRSDLRGRGISMIHQLMDRVDVKHHPQGTEIVMRRDLS